MLKVKLKKEALKECLKIMWLAILFSSISDFLVIFIQTLVARSLGEFTNLIMMGNYESLKENVLFLVFLISLSVFLEPLTRFLQSIFLFKKALVHHSKVIERFLSKDYLKAMKYGAGEISSRWDLDLLRYRTSVIRIVSKPVIIILSSLTVGMCIFENIKFGFVCLFAAMLPVIITSITSKLEAYYYVKESEYEAKKRDHEINLATGHSFLKRNDITNEFIKNIDQEFESFFKETKGKSIVLKNRIEFFNSISKYMAQIIVVVFGVYLLSKGEIETGLIASYLAYLIPIQGIMKELSVFVNSFISYGEFSNRIVEFYSYPENIKGEEINEEIKSIKGESLGFSYDENKVIFKDLNYDIKKGDKVLIVGENGAGKSTFAKILGGLYSRYEGNQKIDDINYLNVNIDSIRDKISYVEQSPYFFKGTLRDNIKMVDENLKDNEIVKLLEKLNIKKDLDTHISDGGTNLSGGEKQKLSIVRGLLRNTEVYILDEPTNNLDADSKEAVKEILKNEKKTVICITHDKDLMGIENKRVSL